ncbi:hypothetical protein HK405_015763, partial [Cladochytrium tenue]
MPIANTQFYPRQYDYHPLVTTADLEQNLLLPTATSAAGNNEPSAPAASVVGASSENLAPGGVVVVRSTECAICFATVFPTPSSAPSVQPSPPGHAHVPAAPPQPPAVPRSSYMVTPCGHLFHTECLERWMAVKFE